MDSVFFSVVVTTYNRAWILEPVLTALATQVASERYEILVVDDGSTDATSALLEAMAHEYPTLRVTGQANAGRAVARNTGIERAHGEFLCYVDSDVLVVPGFIQAHLDAHDQARAKDPDREVFVQGLSVNVSDLALIPTTRVPRRDPSRAFFDTKNVSIRRSLLSAVGGFDTGFVEYGWEDLELGVRLAAAGVGIVRSNSALGYHHHPAFAIADLPKLRRIEEERGRMAARFLAMHPTLGVKLMTQETPLHDVLNAIATWGGLLDERNMQGVWEFLVRRGWRDLAAGWAQIVLNQYNLAELKAARAKQAT